MHKQYSETAPFGQGWTRADEFWPLYVEKLGTFIQSKPANIVPFESALSMWRQQTDKSRPLLHSAPLQLNPQVLSSFAFELQSLLSSRVSPNFESVWSTIEKQGEGSDVVIRFVENVVKGTPTYLAGLSRATNIPLEPLAFFAVYFVRCVRKAVASLYDEPSMTWPYGYCPVCGLWPRMAAIDLKEGWRKLWCIGCDCQWRFQRLACPFCLERNSEKLGYLHFDDEASHRVYTCDSCRRYLKTLMGDFSAINKTKSMDAEYLSTVSFDNLAVAERYIQDFVGFTAFDLENNAAAMNYRKRALTPNYNNPGE